MRRRKTSRTLLAPVLAAGLLGCLTWSGCRRPVPDQSSHAEPAVVSSAVAERDPVPDALRSPSPVDAPTSGKPAERPPRATSPPAVAAGSSAGSQEVDPAVRTLVAGYLESDGQGAYRPNEAAATALERLPSQQQAQLWQLLGDPDTAVRRGAAFFLLGQFDPRQPREVEAFVSLLADRDRTIRSLALSAIRQCPREVQVQHVNSVLSLLEPAREDHPEHRAAAARWLGQLREDARSALPALIAAAQGDPQPRVRSAALFAVAQVAAGEAALPVLIQGLDDQDAAVRLVAAARLRQMDEAAAPAAEVLAEHLADPDPRVSQASAEALLRIGPPAVAPLARQLHVSAPGAKRLALTVLAKLGPAAAPARPQLEACLQDPDPQVQKLAQAVLSQLSGR